MQTTLLYFKAQKIILSVNDFIIIVCYWNVLTIKYFIKSSLGLFNIIYSFIVHLRFRKKKCQLITVIVKYMLKECVHKRASSKGSDLIFWRLVATGTSRQTVLFAPKVGESLISMSFISFLLWLYPLT